jgi:hypothetical protein
VDWASTGANPIVNLGTTALFKVASTAPVRKDFSNKLTRVNVWGDEGGSTRESASAVNPIFGHLEGSVQATGVKDTTQLAKLGDATLQINATATTERTFSYDLSSNQTPSALFPYRTFRPGDWVLVPGENGPDKVRVSQVGITRDADGTTATITVGDLIPDGVAATARKLAQVGGGAIGGGTLRSPLPLSAAIPADPDNLTASLDGYWDSMGAPQAGVALSWSAVTTSVAGTSIDVDLYEVWSRPQLGDPWKLAALATEPTATIAPLPINSTFDFYVRARSVDGIYGGYSDVLSVVTPQPDETLPAPSNPTLDSDAIGTVSVTWDGTMAATTPPLWFNYVLAEISDAEDGAFTVAGQQLPQAGTIAVPGIGAGTWWFRLVGYDKLNVRGTPSDAISIVVTPVVGDNRQPKVPENLAATSEGFWNGASAESRINVSWDAVTEATDDSPIDIKLYELWGKLSTDTTYQVLGTTQDTSISVQPISPIGATWNLEIRAMATNDNLSDLSDPVDVAIASPTMDLLPPSQPQLNTFSGLVIVAWDGNLVDLGPDPDDDSDDVEVAAPDYLASADIQVSVDDGDNWNTVGFMTRGNRTQPIGGLNVGSSVSVRLIAYDVLGQASDPSPTNDIVVDGIDGADINAGTLNANRIMTGTIGVDLVAPSFGSDLNLEANGTITLISGQVADVQAATDTNADNLAEMRTRYDFTPTEAVISQPGSPFQVAISNTQMEFRESGVARAFLNAGVFNAPRMASGQLVLKYHVIENDPAGTVIRRL